MKKLYILLVLILEIVLIKKSFAQDPQFSQFYANPLYLNPALAGSSVCPRVALNYRHEWPNISGTYITSSASFDRLIQNLRSGVGF